VFALTYTTQDRAHHETAHVALFNAALRAVPATIVFSRGQQVDLPGSASLHHLFRWQRLLHTQSRWLHVGCVWRLNHTWAHPWHAAFRRPAMPVVPAALIRPISATENSFMSTETINLHGSQPTHSGSKGRGWLSLALRVCGHDGLRHASQRPLFPTYSPAWDSSASLSQTRECSPPYEAIIVPHSRLLSRHLMSRVFQFSLLLATANAPCDLSFRLHRLS
jgi:hypothetical protein